MFVLGLDIRRSTFLMKEAVEFGQFAMILDAFISAIRARIRNYYGGWFDKFTGDGFLAFWIIEDAPHEIYHNRFVETMGSVLEMGHKARLLFDDIVLEEMRHNSRNMPAGLGVSVGVDAGPGYLVEMADSLTVVGPPVVGAVRMLEASVKPGEILLNVFPGSAFLAGKESTYKDVHFGVDVEFRATKEYKDEGGQEVYVLTAMPHAEDVNEGSP
jgi:class 3 adenylate cyclase